MGDFYELKEYWDAIFLMAIIAYFCSRLSRKTEGMDPAKSWQPAGKMSGATFHHAICVGR